MTEVCSVVDVSQFQAGHSTDKCGFYAVSLLKYAGQSAPSGNASQVSGWADSTYIRYDGPDIFSNANGMTVPMLYSVIADAGLHYQGIGARETAFQVSNLTADYIRAWVRAGYPVVLSVAEDDVWDLDLNEKPYSWDTSGYYHIILCTGIASDGNLLCHDTASVGPQGVRSGPRRYDASKLQNGLTSATAVVLPWLQQPLQGFDPTKQTQEEELIMIQIGSGIGAHFTDLGGDRWQCNTTKVALIGANLAFWRSNGGIFGLPLTNEIYLSQYPGTAIVVFERAISVYDPQRKIDNPPDAGEVYLLHLDSGVGQQMIAKPLTDILLAEVLAQKAQLAAAQQPALQSQVDKLTAKIVQVVAICQAD